MKQTFNNIYKRSSKGDIQIWNAAVEYAGLEAATAVLKITRGKLGGNLFTDERTVVGKSIGKKNETTAYEQACKLAESKMKKKYDEGYRDDVNKIDDVPVLPMKAHPYTQHKAKMPYPFYVSPKIDGLRATARWKDGEVKILSLNGKEYQPLLHLKHELIKVFKNAPDIILDGELYTPRLTFEDICGAVKRDTPNEHTTKVHFHIFDIIDRDTIYSVRKQALDTLVGNQYTTIHNVPSYLIDDKVQLQVFHNKFIQAGYEGTMMRHPKKEYEPNKRSYSLLKYKDFLDAEFEITDVKEGSGGEEGAAVFTCVTKDGDSFSCRPKGTVDHRRNIFDNKASYINRMLTVRYQNLSAEGIPRFPVGIKVRIPEDLSV